MTARVIILRQPGCRSTFPGATVLDGHCWTGFPQVTGRPEAEAPRWALLCKSTDYLPEQAPVEGALLRWAERDARLFGGEALDGIITVEGDVRGVYAILRDNPWLRRLRILQLAAPGAVLCRRRGKGHRIHLLGSVSVALARIEGDAGLIERSFLQAGASLSGYEWRRE